MKRQPEWELQVAITKYLRMQYKDVLFLSDVRGNMRLTLPQAARSKLIQCDGFSCPDLMLFEPRGEWHGLFIELKSESPFKKDGTLKAGEHLANQGWALVRLRQRAYRAEFIWDFDQARELIDSYLVS